MGVRPVLLIFFPAVEQDMIVSSNGNCVQNENFVTASSFAKRMIQVLRQVELPWVQPGGLGFRGLKSTTTTSLPFVGSWPEEEAK